MPAARRSPKRIAATVLACAGALALGTAWRAHVERVAASEALSASAAPVAAAPASQPWTHRTAHFAIDSTASAADTAEVGRAAEALYASWHAFFAGELAYREPADREQADRELTDRELRTREPQMREPGAPLRMRLYAGQAEFKRHNRSRPWAEAFYLRPVSHAYVARGRGNRHHWMLHEVVHQLNAEVLGRRHPRWIEEGLACYFGGSRMRGGSLRAGEIDPDTYPAWWLADFALGEDAAHDARRLRMIPLRAMLTGRDMPSLDGHVNLHYIQHWTLVHYLLHGDGGRHAPGFRSLMGTAGGLEDFERLIGPVDAIEPRWRAHRGAMLAQMREGAPQRAERGEATDALQTRE